MASSSINSMSSFPLSQSLQPSFPLRTSSPPSDLKKPALTTEEFSLPSYVRSADDEGRSEAAASDDMELSIFDARKYFSIEASFEPILSTATTTRISPSVPRFSPASSVDGFSRNHRTRSFRSYAVPTASSEASWNCHTGLLTKPPGSISAALRKPPLDRKSRLGWSGSPRWMIFRRRCPCSVPNVHRRFSNGGFTFPVLEPSISSSPLPPSARKQVIHSFPRPKTASDIITSLNLPLADDPARDSIEVFQPSADTSEVRIAYPASPYRRADDLSINDDAASDASSDLFEIESFTTQSNSTSFPAAAYGRPRDSLDEARPRLSSAAAAVEIYGYLDGQSAYDAATECGYEPSEASVTWSVTTAEGTAFDYASVTNYSVSASDVEEFTRIQLRQHRELERSSGGGLLTSCRCEKAVNVGPNPIKYSAVKSRDKHASYYKPAL